MNQIVKFYFIYLLSSSVDQPSRLLENPGSYPSGGVDGSVGQLRLLS